MDSSSLKFFVWMMMVVILFASPISLTKAQDTSCATKLIPCQPYLNTTTPPPANCCDPIKEAVKTQLTCLCNLYNDPSLFNSLNINVTQAILLSQRCGVASDLNNCKGAAPSPTGTPPGGVPGNDGNRMTWTGFSSVLVLWAASLLY